MRRAATSALIAGVTTVLAAQTVRTPLPAPGTKRRRFVEENAGAAAVHLTAADVAELEATFTPDAAAGDRYNESMARLIDAAR